MVSVCNFEGIIIIWNLVVFSANFLATNHFVILDSSELDVMFSSGILKLFEMGPLLVISALLTPHFENQTTIIASK